MEVSKTKSMVSASHPTLGTALVQKLGPHGINGSLRVKSLGVGLVAGIARNTTVMKTRLKQFRQRHPRFLAFRKAGIDTARSPGPEVGQP